MCSGCFYGNILGTANHKGWLILKKAEYAVAKIIHQNGK